MGPIEEINFNNIKVKIYSGVDGVNNINCNVDVEVRLSDGNKYVATFFTMENLKELFDKFQHTGECANGLYVWATQMIVVRDLSPRTIQRTIENLLEEGELEKAFARI